MRSAIRASRKLVSMKSFERIPGADFLREDPPEPPEAPESAACDFERASCGWGLSCARFLSLILWVKLWLTCDTRMFSILAAGRPVSSPTRGNFQLMTAACVPLGFHSPAQQATKIGRGSAPSRTSSFDGAFSFILRPSSFSFIRILRSFILHPSAFILQPSSFSLWREAGVRAKFSRYWIP